jgi:hypothetical protein
VNKECRAGCQRAPALRLRLYSAVRVLVPPQQRVSIARVEYAPMSDTFTAYLRDTGHGPAAVTVPGEALL